MRTRPGCHIAELDVGRLLAPTKAPRVAEFETALDRAKRLGKRMTGLVWMMEDSGSQRTGNTGARLWRTRSCGSVAAE